MALADHSREEVAAQQHDQHFEDVGSDQHGAGSSMRDREGETPRGRKRLFPGPR